MTCVDMTVSGRPRTRPPRRVKGTSHAAESESEFFRDRIGLPRLLSLPLFGQEVAPGLSRLVAVASAGLFPQPLWISVRSKETCEPWQRRTPVPSLSSGLDYNSPIEHDNRGHPGPPGWSMVVV